MTRHGDEIRVGDIVVDPITGPHLVEKITEYPADREGASFVGAHARRAHGDDWHATILDHHEYETAETKS